MSQAQFPCASCGAALEYAPGTVHLNCPYCGSKNEIPRSELDIEELDYHQVLAQLASAEAVERRDTVTCQSCNAEFTLAPSVHADACPFCGSAVVSEPGQHDSLKPKSLLPFALDIRQARERFSEWLSGLWFAPDKAKRYARADDGFAGIYLPYWTYDSATISFYRGERGDDYWVTVGEDEKGQPRRERRTDWTAVSGTVWSNFDDVLVLASESVPRSYSERLRGWDLANLVPYSDEYLSGFQAERYQIDVEQGFVQAREIMDERIRSAVGNDIGGDRQRIHGVKTQYNNMTFKHLLLPVYVAAYRYRDKIYRFVINGRTGEVQGERPYSAVKIGLTVAIVAAVIAALVYFASGN